MQRFSNQQQTFKLNKHISFAAKPFVDQPGSSMHINVSAHKNNQNIFIKNNNVESETLLYSIGGLCKHMVQDLQYFLPNYSSKERINAHSIETPSTVSWGKNNRSAAIRIPTTDPLHYRLEHRVPSADADPEKVISAILYAIYDGICHKIEPPQITYGIAHDPQYTLIKLL
jgi:glutamine synthetase